ncbi:hypothetical protein GCM10022393_12810 [Aquimarina addita]|uniref:Lipoprotein n=1 Tax=Aquimarina addita TaxID=870485 RepID=A0ABP7XFY3_9FLAO
MKLYDFNVTIRYGALFFVIFLFLNGSCSSQKKQSDSGTDNIKEDFSSQSIETQVSDVDMDTISLINITTYRGAWFEIEFPASFITTPSSPVITTDTYTFIETDEATFESRNGDVTFFVFSPQWGGNPISYLKIIKDEEIIVDKTEKDKDTPPNTYRWVTVKNSKEGYQRSFYSKKTASTHLVFGIKYNNQEAYNLYKNAYIDFKKSLIQYAD